MSSPVRLFPGLSVAGIEEIHTKTALRAVDTFLRDVAPVIRSISDQVAQFAGGGAPAGASFITAGAEGTLSAARVLAANAPITLSDGGPGSTISVGAVFATPAVTLGTAAALGAANTLLHSDCTIIAFDGTNPADLALTAAPGAINFAARQDHVHRFPQGLLSSPSLFSLLLTDDGSSLILTPQQNNLNIQLPSAGSFVVKPDSTIAATAVMTVQMRPGAGNTSALTTALFAGNITGQIVSGWNANMSFGTSVLTGATLAAYRTQVLSVTPGATSDTNNKLYGFLGVNPQIANANGGWLEVAGAYIPAPIRIAGTPSVTGDSAGIITECSTVGTIVQYGVKIRNRTAGSAATDRIGLDIDVQNSGTNRKSIRAADQTDLSSPAAMAQTVLNLHQLATGGVAGAHINFDDKAGDPPSPNTGDLWRNGNSLWFRKATANVDLAAMNPAAGWARPMMLMGAA